MKKYEFTGEAKVVCGVTLKQIVCVTAFASISVGDIGGWIESDRNLDHNSNAWVYGNAQVSGDAWVYGNARVSGDARATKLVKTINSGIYHVTITDNHIRIGCQQRSVEEWRETTLEDIKSIDGEKSAKAWEASKSFILFLAESD